MNLELYKTFHYVAKAKSILKASKELYITQPAVSRAIKQLEEALGSPLFFRTPKGVILTQEGEILFQYTEQIFGFISTAQKRIAEVKNLNSGSIRIGTSDTICMHYLLPILKKFRSDYPSIKISVTDQTTFNTVKSIKEGKIDFGIINMPFDDEQLNLKKILEIQDCFVVGEKYKSLSEGTHHTNEIAEYPLVMLDKTCNSRLYIDQYLKEKSIVITPDFELNDIELLSKFALFDLGIACVVENFVKDFLNAGKLYKVNLTEEIPQRSLSAAWLKSVPLTAAAKFIDYLEDGRNGQDNAETAGTNGKIYDGKSI